ncbi:MAG: response regulator transcription factor [Bacteroidales bacterium]|jgi:DNA-binding response OmpR family regulator|nr:response regulator transcription factor [Bacteroidales bacterium]
MDNSTLNTKQKILIVDDDPNILEILSYNLMNDGYETVLANSAEEAAEKLTPDFSLILLDIMMGGMSGYQFAQSLRSKGDETPIVFLTAKNTENDMLTGFSVGGDDYISKPFSLKEVSARVKAVLKRQKAKSMQTNRFEWKDFIIDFDIKEITIAGKSAGLTKTEFEVVAFLSMNQDKIFSRKELIEHVWNETPFITERTVDVHITRLRKKLGEYAFLISNKSGYGYRFKSGE